jgi:lipoprotein-anchoring transpeptidase ErfK/SrfK
MAVRIAVVLALSVLGALVIYDAGRADRIAEGVSIAGVDVGGMDGEEARTLLRRRFGTEVQRPLLVHHGKLRFRLSPADVGARFDADGLVDDALRRSRRGNPLTRAVRDLAGGEVDAKLPRRVSYSRVAVAELVGEIRRRVDRPARSADIDFIHGKLEHVRARDGIAVRAEALEQAIASELERPGPVRAVRVPVRVSRRPKLTTAELANRYPRVVTVNRRLKQLRFYRRLRLIRVYRIAVGGVGYRTKAGRYEIKTKLVKPPWQAPDEEWAGELAGQLIPPDDPRNPLKARWMEFHDGAGIHGTDDIASLGNAASHGCNRLANPEVKRLYRHVRIGTPVFIS